MRYETACPAVAGAEPKSRSRSPAVLHSSKLRSDPVLPADGYAPGKLRAQTDAEHTEVQSFLYHHPEFSAVPEQALVQYMDRRSGFLDDDELAEREVLRNEGVSAWQPLESDEVIMSDDL